MFYPFSLAVGLVQCLEYDPVKLYESVILKASVQYKVTHSFEERIDSSLPRNTYFCFVAEVGNYIEVSQNILYHLLNKVIFKNGKCHFS